MAETPTEPDIWADWLLHKRHGDDPAYATQVRADVLSYVDRLLDLARVHPGMTLLDVGSGEGAVDIVTTRAALAYVADKPAALREFSRVLKVGGRISLAEPIFQYDALEAAALRMMVERRERGSHGELLQLIHRWKSSQYPDTPAAIAERLMTNFSERTLWEFVRSCGFTNMHMEMHVDMRPAPIKSWGVFLGLSPHPLAPSLAQILSEQFSRKERAILEDAMRPSIESGKALTASYIAYISAQKAPVSLDPPDNLLSWVSNMDKQQLSKL